MSKYETLDYDVILKEEEYEIRKYENFFIVEYENSDDPKIKDGFVSLFKYISSDNKENKKITMTTPVIQEKSSNSKKMSFVAPKEFGQDIPKPNNPNLSVKEFKKGYFGVIKYSGRSNKEKEMESRRKLEDWINKKGYGVKSNYMAASYNSPFTLPMFRRNEVWVRITKN